MHGPSLQAHLLEVNHAPLPSVAEQLRERGHDAVAVQEEADLRGMLDPDLFAEAQRRNRAVLTENTADYIVLDAEYRGRHLAHWGLVFEQPDVPERQGNNRGRSGEGAR
jgi:hypothetical protein